MNGNQKSRSRCQLYSMLLKWICLKPFQQTELENMLVFPSYLSIYLSVYMCINICVYIYIMNSHSYFSLKSTLCFTYIRRNSASPKHQYTFFHYFDLLYTQNSFRIISPIQSARTKPLENTVLFYFIFYLDCIVKALHSKVT